MDSSAIVLNKMLTERSMDLWSRLKLVYLDPAYASLYAAISKYYDSYNNVPSFEELELTLRDGPAQRTLATVKLINSEDISSEVAINALIDHFTQNETVKHLDKFIDKLPLFDTVEIKESLSKIVLDLDEKTHTSETIFTMSEMLLFKSSTDLARERTYLGLNNTFDATLAGVARQELILVGGTRGSGKSITCSNIHINQYQMGNVCPYFTIEMIGQEILERDMAILAGVDYMHIRTNTLEDAEVLRLVQARADMFEDANDLVIEFTRDRDRFKFETNLIRYKKEREDIGKLIIVDDRSLSITSLDLHLGKIKAKYGDKFKLAVVDYVNKVHIEGTNPLDWQPQVSVATKMKELARKHDIVIYSPYQIDASGEARFAKGILDPADIAMTLSVDEGTITFNTTKIRGGPALITSSPIDFKTLKISPQSVETPIAKEKIKKAGGNKKKATTQTDDTSSDIPWNM